MVLTDQTMITVTVAFAPDDKTHLYQRITMPNNATVAMVIALTHWQEIYPSINQYDVGIFSRRVTWDSQVTDGDRIEIYRPLTIDPMRKRKKRQFNQH